MNRILVLSDSHGNEMNIKRALKFAGKVDAIVHLGDFVRDTKYIKSSSKVYSVKGNCDINSAQKTSRTITIGGKRILMVHGHIQRVKLGLLNLGFYAQEKQVDLALFGHTHMPTEQYKDGVLLYNPGSISGTRPTYGIIEIEDDGRIIINTFTL